MYCSDKALYLWEVWVLTDVDNIIIWCCHLRCQINTFLPQSAGSSRVKSEFVSDIWLYNTVLYCTVQYSPGVWRGERCQLRLRPGPRHWRLRRGQHQLRPPAEHQSSSVFRWGNSPGWEFQDWFDIFYQTLGWRLRACCGVRQRVVSGASSTAANTVSCGVELSVLRIISTLQVGNIYSRSSSDHQIMVIITSQYLLSSPGLKRWC